MNNSTDRYIAALEIGSSKITGAVGVFTADQTLKVIAVEQEESRDSVRYGIIQNPEEVASRVGRIIARLESNPAVAPRRITGAYVGISGRSMRSVASEVKLFFPEVTEITGDILARLREDATSIPLDSNVEILDVVPRNFIIDGMETASPRGAMGKSVEATFDIIVGRTELKRNILRAVTERSGVSVKGLIVAALASADIVLSDEEKRLGCMLVDFGAETTTVCIYRKGALCYYATLPLGGSNITRDITSLSILEETAEEIKCERVRAVPRESPSTLNLNLNGIKLADVSNLVVARAEEIVANVVEQIYYAGLTEKDLPKGIVCIGGASHLNGLTELIESYSGLHARSGYPPPFVQTADQRAKRHNTVQTSAILYAGALKGADDCLEMPRQEEPETEETPETLDEQQNDTRQNDGKMGRFFRGISSRFTNMFAPPEDNESELD